MRRFAVGLLASIGGCTLAVDLEGLADPTPPPGTLDPDARDAIAPVDARREDAGTSLVPDAAPDATTPPEGPTRVSCSKPSSCADREGCCIVYGPAQDYCTDALEKCKFETSRTVFITCDDEDDCTALGSPGTVCCGELDGDGNTFLSVSCRTKETCTGVPLCDAIRKTCPNGKPCQKGNHASDVWTCD